MATILITGANGQMGREFRHLSNVSTHRFVFADRSSLDITDIDQLTKFFTNEKIDFCINCAAYTAVDKAEDESDQAYMINEKGVENLAEICNSSHTVLIHYSSDYVYHSIATRALIESDECRPRGIYAKSKRAGEIKLTAIAQHWILLRVSWLYSSYGNNFVKTMLRLSTDRDALSIVADQLGSPTYAGALARDTIKIIDHIIQKKQGLNQIYNYSNLGVANWADFARTIFKLSAIDCAVNEITTAEFGARAPRPYWSVMSKDKVMSTFNLSINEWRDDLVTCLALIKSAD